MVLDALFHCLCTHTQKNGKKIEIFNTFFLPSNYLNKEPMEKKNQAKRTKSTLTALTYGQKNRNM